LLESKRGDHTSERERERESVCGQLLIRSILVLLYNFDVPLKKLSKEKVAVKRNEKSNNKEGTLCVFSFPLCGGAL
jgi:hypothetical protein